MVNYFIAYKYHDGENTATGNATIKANKKIKSDEDIRELEKKLMRVCESDWCCIINFILL